MRNDDPGTVQKTCNSCCNAAMSGRQSAAPLLSIRRAATTMEVVLSIKLEGSCDSRILVQHP
jgi:hypothetical protein